MGCDDTDSFRVLDAEEETLASPSMCLFQAGGYAQRLAKHEQDAHDLPTSTRSTNNFKPRNGPKNVVSPRRSGADDCRDAGGLKPSKATLFGGL